MQGDATRALTEADAPSGSPGTKKPRLCALAGLPFTRPATQSSGKRACTWQPNASLSRQVSAYRTESQSGIVPFNLDDDCSVWNRFRTGIVWYTKTEANMPGDPRECRQHALTYVQLVQTAATQQARENFAKLARAWIRLAEDLEWSQAFLVAVNKRWNRPAEKGADRSRRPRLIMKAMKLPTYR